MATRSTPRLPVHRKTTKVSRARVRGEAVKTLHRRVERDDPGSAHLTFLNMLRGHIDTVDQDGRDPAVRRQALVAALRGDVGPHQRDTDVAVRRYLVERAAMARAKQLLTREYARTRLAELGAEFSWLMQELSSTDEDRDTQRQVLAFLDRHGIAELIVDWGCSDELLEPRVVNAAAKERVHEQLRREGVRLSWGRERLSNSTIAVAFDEGISAHRERVRQLQLTKSTRQK